jgi:hypothetical protein
MLRPMIGMALALGLSACDDLNYRSNEITEYTQIRKCDDSGKECHYELYQAVTYTVNTSSVVWLVTAGPGKGTIGWSKNCMVANVRNWSCADGSQMTDGVTAPELHISQWEWDFAYIVGHGVSLVNRLVPAVLAVLVLGGLLSVYGFVAFMIDKAGGWSNITFKAGYKMASIFARSGVRLGIFYVSLTAILWLFSVYG